MQLHDGGMTMELAMHEGLAFATEHFPEEVLLYTLSIRDSDVWQKELIQTMTTEALHQLREARRHQVQAAELAEENARLLEALRGVQQPTQPEPTEQPHQGVNASFLLASAADWATERAKKQHCSKICIGAPCPPKRAYW